MRQLVKAAAILAGMMAFSGIGFAQCKIVVVDMQDAVIGSNEGQAQAKKFDAKTAEWTAKLEKKKTDLEALNTKYKQQQALGSASTVADLKKQIETADKDLTRMTEDAQKEVDDYRDQLLSPIMTTAQATLDALATEKNYSLVYDSSAPNSPIVYSSKDCDITAEVKTRMNAKSGAAAAPASTAAPARGTNPPIQTGTKPPTPPPLGTKPSTPAPPAKNP